MKLHQSKKMKKHDKNLLTIRMTCVMHQAGMQNDELKGGGRTHTKCGPAGLQHIFARLTFGSSSCGGRTYPAASGTHNIEISILEPVNTITIRQYTVRQ